MKPVLQALVVADHVYQDKPTGKFIIAGTFNKMILVDQQSIAGKSPQGQQWVYGGIDSGTPWVYFSLTDICQTAELTLQFVNISTNQAMFGTKLSIQCNDRLQTVEIAAPLPRLPIKEPGTYALELLCEGEIVGSHRITAERGAMPPPAIPN